MDNTTQATETLMEQCARRSRERFGASPAGQFWNARLSPEAVSRRLAAKADGYTVEHASDASDGYADYTGVKVTGPDVARAVRWLAKALAADVYTYRCRFGGQHAIYTADGDTGVILMSRWSLGD